MAKFRNGANDRANLLGIIGYRERMQFGSGFLSGNVAMYNLCFISFYRTGGL